MTRPKPRTSKLAVAIAAIVACVACAAIALTVAIHRKPELRLSYPTTPEQWEEGGYADFASGMAALYGEYDHDLADQRVRVSQAGVLVAGEGQVRELEVTDDGGLRTGARGLLESLGYACQSEGDGFRATNRKRGDEVVVSGGSVEVNGKPVEVGAVAADGGSVTVSVGKIAEALGYEVIEAGDAVTLQDPWQTARVVATGGVSAEDAGARKAVEGPDGMVVLQYATSREAREAAERLLADGSVTWAAPDRIIQLCGSDDDWEPAEPLSWGNDVIGSTEMQVRLVRQYGSIDNLPEVVVAVIDSGLDMDHELFTDRLVQGYDAVEGDYDPEAIHMHGTHASGIVINNTTENVKIMPLRAGNEVMAETSVSSCIQYAISHGAHVVNMSFGGDYGSSDSWEDTMEYRAMRAAKQAGLVMVAAHGNDGIETSTFYPASDDAVISATALKDIESIASFSNYGQSVDFCAPGDEIYSATLGGSYENQSGTSMAAPYVSAASALVLSSDLEKTPDYIFKLLRENARDLGEEGWDEYYGYGCVDVSNMVKPASSDIARIGAKGFDSFQSAYDAAVDGDTIILLENVVLPATFELSKDVTIRSTATQSIELAKGATLPLFKVTGSVILGDSAGVGRSLELSSMGQSGGSALISIDKGAGLTIEESVALTSSVNNGATVFSEGELVVNGAIIENTTESGLSIDGSGVVSLEGDPNIEGTIRLSKNGYIKVGHGIPEDKEYCKIKISDPSEGRLVLSWQEGGKALPIYLEDSSWKLTAKGTSYVMERAVAYDARIGNQSYESISDAMQAARDGDTVTVCRDAVVSETIVLAGHIKIDSDGLNTLYALPSLDGPLIRIAASAEIGLASPDNSSFRLNGLNEGRTSPLVEVDEGGSLLLGKGAVVSNFSSTFGDVSPILNNGELVIDGGVISDNHAYYGGGIFNCGSMELKSGTVCHNTAQHGGGGVYNTGSLTVSGGSINGNKTTDAVSSDDGYIYSGLEARGGGIWNDGLMRIDGGSISDNTSDFGGGVFNSGSGTLAISGGTIAQNKAFSLNPIPKNLLFGFGVVQGCSESGYGGGVCSDGILEITGGMLQGNTALERGGGVGLTGGTMTMTGGGIVDNILDGESSSEPRCSGPGLGTFFPACGIYSAHGASLKLKGGTVKSSAESFDNALISSISGTELSGDFTLEGGMLWPGDAADGLPIKVTSELTSTAPIKLFTLGIPSNVTVARYDGAVQPDASDFSPLEYELTANTYAGKDALRVDGQDLILSRPKEIIAAAGWTRNGTCEYRIDGNGALTIRPINGITGVLKDGFSHADITSVVVEDGVAVKEASYLFYACSQLKHADISGMRGVENALMMFADCQSLQTISLPQFDQLVDASCMFDGCTSLTSIDTKAFATSRLANTSRMFASCESLESIDLSYFDMSQVSSIGSMFDGCISLKSFDLSSWNTSHVASMSFAFAECKSLKSLDLSMLDTSSVTDMAGIFDECNQLSSISIANWNTSSVEYMDRMFRNCSSLSALDIRNWDTSSVKNMYAMFQGCTSLRKLDVSPWNTSSVEDMRWLFSGCSEMNTLDVSRWNTSKVTNMSLMFGGCSALTQLNLSSWDTSRVKDMSSMFSGCEQLKSIDVSGFSTEQVRDFACMFYECRKLSSLDLSRWKTKRAHSLDSMFYACSSLKELDFSSFDATTVARTHHMFEGCYDLSSFSIPVSWPVFLDGAVPSSTSDNGKWWSTSDGRWYSCEEIQRDRKGIADTYTSTGVSHVHQAGEPAKENEVAASCDVAGYYDLVTRCKTCREIMTTQSWSIPALGHDYETVVVEATWDEGGYTIHRCRRCGDEYVSDETEPLKAIAERVTAPVVKAIDSLPTVTDLALTDAPAVAAARAAYDSLDEQQKSLVSNTATLEAAEARLQELQANASQDEIDEAAASGVDTAIANLPALDSFTLEDADAVAYARALYSQLTDAQKALVIRLAALEAAEARIAELRAEAPSSEWSRLSGKDRYLTMSAVVSAGFDSSRWAVVATGGNFPDALVASSLAGYRGCPVVLTDGKAPSLGEQARAQLERLGVTDAYVVGGSGVVSEGVASDMRSMGISVTRVSGAGRQATSVAAFREVAASDPGSVVVATGSGFADALSIGPWCYAEKAPILLASDGVLSDEQVAAVRGAKSIRRVVVVGGKAAVSDEVRAQLGDGYDYVRLSGANRYATSAAIAEWAMGEGDLGLSKVAVATGANYPDALAGAALCGSNASALLLVAPGADLEPARSLLSAHAGEVELGYALGGTGAVPDALVDALREASSL